MKLISESLAGCAAGLQSKTDAYCCALRRAHFGGAVGERDRS